MQSFKGWLSPHMKHCGAFLYFFKICDPGVLAWWAWWVKFFLALRQTLVKCPSLPHVLQVTRRAGCPALLWPQTRCERCTARYLIMQRRSSASVRVRSNASFTKSNWRALTCKRKDQETYWYYLWVFGWTSSQVTCPVVKDLGRPLHGVKLAWCKASRLSQKWLTIEVVMPSILCISRF